VSRNIEGREDFDGDRPDRAMRREGERVEMDPRGGARTGSAEEVRLVHVHAPDGTTGRAARQVRPAIEIAGVSKAFETRSGTGPLVLEDIDLTIAENEFVSLVGRSGCGKTTLLNIVAGLDSPTAGEVRIAGRPVLGPGQGQGVVFQQHALFPWLTAIDNVAFGFRGRAMSRKEKREHGRGLLELVGLDAAADKYPRELSGGMQQRVAIARALALDPQILLMDEPFGALDELTRIELQQELLRIWDARKKTVVFVTHSIDEALILSDRIVLLSPHPGRVREEFGIPLPRPRARTDPRFNALYEEIWNGLSG
jgi:ABC-type nitrate/sulfonate/bicarbonate transport system ATPase subunit